jgi:hypothetical protein
LNLDPIKKYRNDYVMNLNIEKELEGLYKDLGIAWIAPLLFETAFFWIHMSFRYL